MPISLAIFACGCGLIYFGTRGFTTKGIKISKTENLSGTGGKVVGVICILGGAALGLFGLVMMILVINHQSHSQAAQ